MSSVDTAPNGRRRQPARLRLLLLQAGVQAALADDASPLEARRTRLWFDTNAAIDSVRYSLSCAGTLRDLASHGLELQVGMAVSLYMEDHDEDVPALLLVDAVVERQGAHFVARVDNATWRHERV